MVSAWPVYKEEWNFAGEEHDTEIIKEAVRAIRGVRTSMNVPPSKKASVYVVSENDALLGVFEHSRAFFAALVLPARCSLRRTRRESAGDAVSAVIPGAAIYMPFAELVDIAKEIERLKAEEKRLNGELAPLQRHVEEREIFKPGASGQD